MYHHEAILDVYRVDQAPGVWVWVRERVMIHSGCVSLLALYVCVCVCACVCVRARVRVCVCERESVCERERRSIKRCGHTQFDVSLAIDSRVLGLGVCVCVCERERYVSFRMCLISHCKSLYVYGCVSLCIWMCVTEHQAMQTRSLWPQCLSIRG